MGSNVITGAFIHHIALRAKDYDASVGFYRDALGMSIKGEWGKMGERACMLTVGNGGIVELYEGGTQDLPEDYETRNGSFFHLAIAVDDVDAAYHKALAAGGIVHIEPTDNVIDSQPPMPIRMAFVRGLNGELLEFFKDL